MSDVSATPPRLPLPADFRKACDDVRSRGSSVGFVPTMGALHEGHLSLVREAKKRSDWVAASIFVNPTQFGPSEDYSRYPRDLDGDVKKLASAGADLVFCPAEDAMYPKGEQTRVRVGSLAEPLCGAFRKGHFEGVATVVTKLFALTGACVAVFGRKDYQQLCVVRRLVTDLMLPVEVVGHPIVREADGLALSSRNAYLSAADRERALGLSLGLRRAHEAFARGERNPRALEDAAREDVEMSADRIDYVSVVGADDLETLSSVDTRALIAIACHIGKTRLIDNMVLGEDPPP
jgi:pantoate--beta-alanine ligase